MTDVKPPAPPEALDILDPSNLSGEDAPRRLRAALLDLLGDPDTPSVIERSRQVFCNRNLRMTEIEHIGFDMDYTLARYHQQNLDQLTLDLTLERLIARGYPESIREIHLPDDFAIRGLVIDKARGNIFKMDSHRHVGKAYHGFRPLTEEEHAEYNRSAIRFTDQYHLIDTLFALPEASLYAALVDHFDRPPATPIPYPQLFEDLRASIDLVHRDGSLKNEIIANTARYILPDPDLAATLHRYRSSGKRLFVMTNSMWPYTDHVMRFLLDGVLPEYPSWRNYFDIVITGARKPTFFTGDNPFIALGADGKPSHDERTRFEKGVVYQHGNLPDFERMLGTGGPAILYVGDHIYGDILKSRKVSSWRTCMVVQEMDAELRKAQLARQEISQRKELDLRLGRASTELYFLRHLERRSDAFFERLQQIEPERSLDDEIASARHHVKRQVQQLRRLRKELIQQLRALDVEIDRDFHSFWGLVFNEGNEQSIFGKQVQDYACLYASRVSSLGSYSPLHSFHAPPQPMPHEY